MICSNKECAKEFDSKTHNQKYCSDECCRVATNKRIMEKYYEKKAIKNGSLRQCKKCKSQLSRYNTDLICSKCNKEARDTSKSLTEVLDEISRLS
jgi:hypothetical protein